MKQSTVGSVRWAEFRNGFKDRYFDTIASDDLKRFAQMAPDVLMDLSMVLCYGNPSKALMRMFVDRALSGIFDTDVHIARPTSHIISSTMSVPYASSNIHVELDFFRMDRDVAHHAVCDFFAKHIGSCKPYERRKHIVVMHNLDHIPHQSAMALRKLVETGCGKVVVVATASNLSRLNEALRSRSVFVRCNVSAEKERLVLDKLMAACGEEAVEGTLRCQATLVSRICSVHPYRHMTMAESVMNDFIEKKLDRCKSILDAVPCIRKLVADLSKLRIESSDVMKAAISIADSRGLESIAGLVEDAAKLEHSSHVHLNPNLSLETFLVRLYDRLVSCPN
jgi:hypothetical protein